MNKQNFISFFRKMGLMPVVDKLYYKFNKARFSAANKKFIKENSQIKLPPSYAVYEAYRMDYKAYITDGKETAFWIIDRLKNYLQFESISILDWGCGPARVVRHLPELLPASCKIFGSDYNVETINWCKQNLPGINFSVNKLDPPLEFPDNFFNAVYALSVFTHLSEQNHNLWLNELHRVIQKNGILLITTQGKAFLNKLTKTEKKLFEQDKIVVRDNTPEGHRTYSAFHPENFMKKIFSAQWEVLKFEEGNIQEWGSEQDTWILKKI